jgi:hypothetical protein
MIEVIYVDPISPTSYCWKCRKLFKVEDEIEIKQVPIITKFGKQKKKLKANTYHGHKQHIKCEE